MNDQTITATSGDDDSKASPDARPMSDDVSGTTAHPVIEDVAPRRIHDFGDLVHAVSAVLLAAVAILSSIYLSGFVTGVESDAHSAGRALNWMVDLPTSMLQRLTIVTIAVMAIVQLLVGREWLQSALALLAMFGGLATVWGISMAVSTFGNFTFITALSSPSSIIGTGLLPDFYAGSAALLTVAGPRRTRSTVKWGWNILYISSAILILLSINSVTGVIVSLSVGRLVGMLIRFAAGTKNQGAWGEDLVQALNGIGLHITSLKRRMDVDLSHGSLASTLDDDLVEGSRLYDAVDDWGRAFVVSALDSQARTAGYVKQLWQWVRFTGVAMRRDRSPREATQHHMAMILGLRNAGLPTPKVYGVADTGETSILVLHGDDIMHECNLNTLSDKDAIALLRFLSVANKRGYTHRRITPDTLARLESGTPIIAGWQNGDDASAAPNIALDQVQLLLLLAVLIGPERAVAAGRDVLGDDTMISLTPFIQKAAIPAGTRALPGWNKHIVDDMRAEMRALAPQETAEAMEPVSLSRFSPRSFIGMVLLIVAVVVIFTQLKPEEIITALTNANPLMAVVTLAFGVCGWIGSSISLGSLMARHKRDNMGVFMSQVAGGFATVSMPAGVGPSFVNLQFLRKSGYRNTPATAIMSAALVVYYAVYFSMLVIIGLFTGRNMFSGAIPTNTLVIVLGVVVVVLSIAMMIPPLRHWVTRRLMPLAKTYINQLLDVLSQPRQLTVSCLGALFQNATTGLAFWAALQAFGHSSNPIETTFVFLLAYALGSAVPTPGGLGGVEAALTFAFVAVGVPQGVALSATLLHRVVFYWLRIPLGAAAMKWLDKHNLV